MKNEIRFQLQGKEEIKGLQMIPWIPTVVVWEGRGHYVNMNSGKCPLQYLLKPNFMSFLGIADTVSAVFV